jgi:hypothetical protein
MKNFQGLHKCATGAVINTEDFMKSKQSNTGSMLTGVNNSNIGGDDWAKQQRRRKRALRKRDRQNAKPRRSACKSML